MKVFLVTLTVNGPLSLVDLMGGGQSLLSLPLTAKDCFSRSLGEQCGRKYCTLWGSDSAREGLGRGKCPLRRGIVAAIEGFGMCHTLLGPWVTLYHPLSFY